MKNKEIEELLNEIKFFDGAYVLEGNNRDLLLSYIKQLKNRNKELYEGFMATQEELTDYATKNEQLENNRDKAIRTLETLKGSARWERHLYEVDYILDILKGDSDENK